MASHLDGSIALEGNPAVNVVVRFFTPSTDTEVHRSAAITDASGNFDIYDAPVGTFDVGIKPQHCLSQLAASQTFTEGGTTVIDFGAIRRGDLNLDDYITSVDQTIMFGHWGEGGDCYGYAGDWLMPEAAPAVGAIASSKFNRGLN